MGRARRLVGAVEVGLDEEVFGYKASEFEEIDGAADSGGAVGGFHKSHTGGRRGGSIEFQRVQNRRREQHPSGGGCCFQKISAVHGNPPAQMLNSIEHPKKGGIQGHSGLAKVKISATKPQPKTRPLHHGGTETRRKTKDKWVLLGPPGPAGFIQGRVSIFRTCVAGRKMRARKN